MHARRVEIAVLAQRDEEQVSVVGVEITLEKEVEPRIECVLGFAIYLLRGPWRCRRGGLPLPVARGGSEDSDAFGEGRSNDPLGLDSVVVDELGCLRCASDCSRC